MIDINYNKNHTIETKETCIDTFERQADTFVELFVTKEVPASTELTVTHTICENKNDGCSFKDIARFLCKDPGCD